MTGVRHVLASAAAGTAGDAVRSVAAAIATGLEASVEERGSGSSLFDASSRDAREALIGAAGAEDVVGAVVAASFGRDGAAVAMRFAAAIEKPVVFAPPAGAVPFALRRMLIPLDGTRSAADAVRPAERIALALGADVVVLHCIHEASVPLFEDRPHYDADDWAREFAARFRDAFGDARLEVREGPPAEHAIDLCRTLGADLVVLGWSRRPAPTRTRTVRAMLERSPVPVMLLPAHPAGQRTA